MKESTFKSFDGTKISYRINGRGKKTLLCFNGIAVSRWAWLPLEKYFEDKYTIITWDYRGHGTSGAPKLAPKAQFHDLVKDASLLINHLKIKKAVFIAHSSGLQVALETIKQEPKSAEKLISCMGTPGHVLEHFMDSFVGELIFDVAYIVNAVCPEASYWINTNLLANPLTYQIGAALKLSNPAIHGKEEVLHYLKDFSGMNITLFNSLMASASKHSAEDMLGKIKMPSLLIASENDRFVPLAIAKKMNSGIKGSKLFVIKNGTHAALFEQPDIFNLVIEKFLD